MKPTLPIVSKIIHHFWKHVRNNAKVWNDVLAITSDNGSTTSSDYETANSLNNFFTSVFSDEPLTNIPSLGDRSNGFCLDRISITYDDVLYELNRPKAVVQITVILVC